MPKYRQGTHEEALQAVEELVELLEGRQPRWETILAEGITDEDKADLYTMLNGVGAATLVHRTTPEEDMTAITNIFQFAFCLGYQRGRGNRPVIKWIVAEEEDES